MDILKKLFAKKIPAPTLYQGALLEISLYPLHGYQDEREQLIGDRRARVVWVEFGRNNPRGNAEPTLKLQEVRTGLVIGDIPPRVYNKQPALLAALESGVTAATAWLTLEGEGYEAELRLGEHKFMPNPYWK